MKHKLYPLKLYLRALPNTIMLSASLFFNLAIWVWLYWQIKPQQDSIFLHYNILFGVDYVGPRWQMSILPLSGLAIFVFNAGLAWFYFNKDKFVSYLANSAALLCQIFLLVAAWLLIFLNV